MNSEMEKLMDLAVADGIITEKERAVLSRKAKELGIDQDEFDMVLEAKLYQRNQSINSMHLQKKEKTQSEVAADKCPSCGADVPSLRAHCPYCGHEAKGIRANSSWERLSVRLSQVDREYIDRTAEGGIVRDILTTGFPMFSSTSKVNGAKAAIISAFPVPNTKEDLMEFILAAAPLASKKAMGMLTPIYEPSGTILLSIAYRNLVASCISKAQVVLTDDSESLMKINEIKKILKLK